MAKTSAAPGLADWSEGSAGVCGCLRGGGRVSNRWIRDGRDVLFGIVWVSAWKWMYLSDCVTPELEKVIT